MGQNSVIELNHTLLSALQATDLCIRPHEKPSILWEDAIIKSHEYSKRSKGSIISIFQGKNDILCCVRYYPQGSVESVVIKKFVSFYTKRAEEFLIVLKKAIKVFAYSKL